MSEAERRQRIVDGARQLLLRQGYARTTTDQIAARCQISKQTLYRVFPGKLAVFTAIIDEHRQSMLALPGDYSALPIDRALEQIFRIDIDPQADSERIALLQLAISESQQFPKLKSILRKHGAERSHCELVRWLTEQADAGRLTLRDPNHDAQILMDMISGPVLRKSVANNLAVDKWDSRKIHVRRCIEIFLRGVSPHPGRA